MYAYSHKCDLYTMLHLASMLQDDSLKASIKERRVCTYCSVSSLNVLVAVLPEEASVSSQKDVMYMDSNFLYDKAS